MTKMAARKRASKSRCTVRTLPVLFSTKTGGASSNQKALKV